MSLDTMVNEKNPLTPDATYCDSEDADSLGDEDESVELEELPFSYQYESIEDNPQAVEKLHNITDKHRVLYSQRWWVLISFCLINMSNGWSWATWSPLTALVADSWDVSQGAIDALSGINMFVFVPGNIASMWLVVNHLGLSKGLRIGAVLNVAGLAIRYGGVMLSESTLLNEYQMVFLGTILCAVGNTFILPMITLLSGNWFARVERATATSLGVFAYNLGCMFGLGSTVVMDFRIDDATHELDKHKLDVYLRVQLITSLVAFFMVMTNLTSDRPPTPPSRAAATLVQNGETVDYHGSVKLILACPAGHALFLVFGLSMGVFYAIPPFLSQFMPTWAPHLQGWLGGIYQISAVIGCSVAGKLVSWFNMEYKGVGLLLLGSSFLFAVLYAVSVFSQSYLALVACGGLGFCFCTFMTVGMEYATALTFPADEAAVYGLLDSTGELCGFFLVLLGGFMSHHGLEVHFCGIMTGLISIALVVLYRLDGKPSRPVSNGMQSSKLDVPMDLDDSSNSLDF